MLDDAENIVWNDELSRKYLNFVQEIPLTRIDQHYVQKINIDEYMQKVDEQDEMLKQLKGSLELQKKALDEYRKEVEKQKIEEEKEREERQRKFEQELEKKMNMKSN